MPRPSRMAFYARAVTLGALLIVLCGCGGDSAPCAPVGTRQGIGVEIEPSDAVKVAAATLTACWNGTCRERDLALSGTSRNVPMGCTGDAPDDTCGVSSSPDGGKHGFADLADLPAAPVQVTVELRDGGGERLLRQKIDVTPSAKPLGGNYCGSSTPQAGLVVSGGKVSARR